MEIDPNKYSLDNYVYLVYCEIGSYKKWIRDSIDPAVFFKNYDELMSSFKALLENALDYVYYEPNPYKDMQDYIAKYSENLCLFIRRAWDSTISKASLLKTDSAKKKRIDSFFCEIEKYNERLTDEARALLQDLRDTPLNYGNLPKKAKKLPVFDLEAEKALRLNFHNADDYVAKHFALIGLAEFYYKYRDVSNEYLEMCIDFCKKDIKLLPLAEKEYVDRLLKNQDFPDSKRRDIISRGLVSYDTAFKRLAIIYEKSGDYDKAISICYDGLRISKNLYEKEDFKKRIDRYQAKLDKREQH